ncbi:hypothetical protein BJY52DRAFT_1279315 [Lactarius psammicola]|nr:hypothetical protein BJY52DRAFT_1279315 [Lactarius psammicola]
MSAAIPTPSSSQAAPPASPPFEIHSDPDPDPTPTAIAPPEVVAETKPDESITSLPPAPQSPAQPPVLGDQPARVEIHAPEPTPALRTVPTRPPSTLSASRIEGERPLPAVPANATLPPRMEAPLRARVASDLGNGDAHRPLRRSEVYLAQPLERPGSRIYRQRPATYPSESEPQDVLVPRVTSLRQNIDYSPGSVGARLHPTLDEAVKVRDSASLQAKWITYSINIAIALQVVLGALTTALGASLTGNSTRISIAVLGSLSTLVASYLARTRGTSEPESSLLREQAISNFIRQLRAFILDHGIEKGHDQVVEKFRKEFERLLNASDPNTKKPPLFDLELKFDDEALSKVGLTNDDVADLRRGRRERANTLTGANGATGPMGAK